MSVELLQQDLSMVRLRLQQIARQREYTMYRIAKESGLTMNAVRRYWYSTADGSRHGPPLTRIDFAAIEKLADLFEIAPGDLFEKVED